MSDAKTKQIDEIHDLEEKYGVKGKIPETKLFEGFTNALEVFENKTLNGAISFGIENLDKLFMSSSLPFVGIPLGQTVEIFGGFASGKTQLCHQLCVNVQLPVSKGGIAKKAIYVDTEGTFSPSRIIEISKDKNVDSNQIMKNIFVARAKSSDHQIQILDKIKEILIHNPSDFGLIIIDSLVANLSAEYTGLAATSEKLQIIAKFLWKLKIMAEDYNLLAVVTNQVRASMDKFFGSNAKHVGGDTVAHWAAFRCHLRKSKGEKRVIRMVQSIYSGENETVFEITQEGIKEAS